MTVRATVLAALVAAAAWTLGGSTPMAPRGIRNNNPGNLRTAGTANGIGGPDPWRGLVGEDDQGFGIFDTMANGVRALYRTLRTYQDRHGLRTVREIITRWAPPTENDTAAYVEHVARVLGVDPDAPIVIEAHASELVAVIIQHENGQPVDRATIAAGVMAA